MISRLVLNLRSLSREKNNTTYDPGEADIVFRDPAQQSTRFTIGGPGGRGITTSMWSRALEDLGDIEEESCGSSSAIPRIEVTTEVVCDVPLQQLEPVRHGSAKGFALV